MALFQLQTLRPILKMQNELLLNLFRQHLLDAKLRLDNQSDPRRRELIEQALTRQGALKALMIGTIVGHFTSEEYTFYQQNRAEVHKRLTRFLAKRIGDGLFV